MLQAMYNGVSNLLATQEDMDVIGNNIANVSTTAYKASSVSFADQLSQTLQGASAASNSVGGTNPNQVGTGVKIASINTVESQGGLTATSTPTDLAIEGNGYFMLSNPTDGITYTRDGSFSLDNNGDLVSATTGEFVLGWPASATGAIDTSAEITPASTIQIGVGTDTIAQATANATVSGNVSSGTAAGGTVTTTVDTYDSLGNEQPVTLTLTPVAGTPNTWDWTASGNAGLTAPTGTTNQGTVTFNSNGTETASTGSIQLTLTNGATSPQNIAVNFTGATQVSGTSTLDSAQDGYPSGTLESYSIDPNGIITGQFSNGLTQSLGQVALAGFSNPQGLASDANNEYSPTPNSGTATVGTANSLGLGSINSGYLEQSNVDLGTEFANMIVAQNAYEANTKIVSTVSTMLQDLDQMVQQ